MSQYFSAEVKPDYEALLAVLRREGTPGRVHFFELFLDANVRELIDRRFALEEGVRAHDVWRPQKLMIRRRRLLGYDYLSSGVQNISFPRLDLSAQDTAPPDQSRDQRSWVNEHEGTIQSWQDFEEYPWPDPAKAITTELEWYSRHLPDDMCLSAACHNVFEQVTWLMSYEGLCLAIYEQPELVDAMFEKIGATYHRIAEILVQFERVKFLFGGDDMGFKTQTMISPRILIEKSIPWHGKMAKLAHQQGKLYLIHACGNLDAVMPALIEAGIDGKHSFEDAIEPVTVAKKRWGDRIAVLGGIDVDFLARADEAAIRKRVRETLEVCQPGGGYCLGSGNSIANYIPVDHYLVMLDEGRKW